MTTREGNNELHVSGNSHFANVEGRGQHFIVTMCGPCRTASMFHQHLRLVAQFSRSSTDQADCFYATLGISPILFPSWPPTDGPQ